VLQAHGPTILPAQLADLLPSVPAGRSLTSSPELVDPLAVRRRVVERIAMNERNLLGPLVTAFEQAVIRAAVEECGGNLSLASRHLGIHRVTLKARLRDAGTDREQALEPGPN
jgi:DNA-binding NtrC family response regulator